MLDKNTSKVASVPKTAKTQPVMITSVGIGRELDPGIVESIGYRKREDQAKTPRDEVHRKVKF